MSWNLETHPYRLDKVGGVNSYAVAFNNWLIVGALLWFTGYIMFADMSSGQVEATARPADAGIVYTPEDYAREAIASITMPTAPAPQVNVTVVIPTPQGADNAEDPQPIYSPTDNLNRPAITAGYSYYNPRLGGVNCLDFQGGECRSPLADGDDWRDWIDRGAVAVAPEWLNEWGLGLGDTLLVLAPDIIAGEYVVKDVCSGCSARHWGDGRFRVDFLSTFQHLQWNTDVVMLLPASVGPR